MTLCTLGVVKDTIVKHFQSLRNGGAAMIQLDQLHGIGFVAGGADKPWALLYYGVTEMSLPMQLVCKGCNAIKRLSPV